MKTNAVKLLSAWFIIGSIFSSCLTDRKGTGENKITFDSVRVERTVPLLKGQEEPNCEVQVTYTFPGNYEDKVVLQEIQQHFMGIFLEEGETSDDLAPKQIIERYADNYINEYMQLESEYSEGLEMARKLHGNHWSDENSQEEGADPVAGVKADYSYYDIISNEITYNAHNLLSYTAEYSTYSGGAHGRNVIYNYTLDLTNGHVLLESDLYVDGYQNELAKLLVAGIAENNGVEDSKALEDMGYYSIDEIFPNGNFYVTDKGAHYSFNEYDIAAYAIGNSEVFIPYEKLRHLLKPGSPVAVFTE